MDSKQKRLTRELAAETFEAYRDWSPTGFDTTGLCADTHDIGDWLVLPLTRTRDTEDEPMTASNWHAWLKGMPTPEGQGWDIHNFGHWAVGWFEIVLVSPNAAATLAYCLECATALEDYPLLDENDHSEREHQAEVDDWESWGRSEFIDNLDIAVGSDHHEEIDVLLVYISDQIDVYPTHDSEGTHWDFAAMAEVLELADYIHLCDVLDVDNYIAENGTEVESDTADEIVRAINVAEWQVTEYTRLCPDYAEKAALASAEGVKALEKELQALALHIEAFTKSVREHTQTA